MAISLASISRTQRASAPPRIVVHGTQGVGKSTFAAGAYKPIFLPFEDGLTGIETDRRARAGSGTASAGAIGKPSAVTPSGASRTATTART